MVLDVVGSNPTSRPKPIESTMSIGKSYDEIIDFLAAGTTPDALVAFRPSQKATQRVDGVG